jgi:hypothetical protein
MMKPWHERAGRIRKLVAQRALDNAHAAVDGGSRRLGVLAGLESKVLHQARCAQSLLTDGNGMVHAVPPTQKVQ